MEQLLESLSFTKQQVQKISLDAHSLMSDATKDKGKILEARTKQLTEINKKFDRLEERLMDDELMEVLIKGGINIPREGDSAI